MKKQAFNHQWICNGQPVTLPHDAMLHEKRDPQAACGSAGAFFPGGKYTYEKRFMKPDGARVVFQFEGVYKNACVKINGKEAGGAVYGYTPFFVNADPFLTEGENIITVTCDCVDQPDSRWYSGAGIYRPVWMWTGPENSILPESVRVSTISCSPAEIRVQSRQPIVFEVMGIRGEGTDFCLRLPGAKPWSDTSPQLYTASVSNGSDTEQITFGIRKVEWSSKGLFINGKETLLRGGCLHHDHGILGAATYDESEYRRIKKLKEAGYNAVRSSHNPASRALLDACDKLGVYVMDETWDMWFHHKTKHDYASQWREHHMEDLSALVSRDYNHPSVILYSIGNEVSEPAKPEGISAIQEMVDYLHREDPNRAVTGGFNLMILSKASKGKGIYDESGAGRDDSADKKMSGMNSTMFNLITSMIGTGMNKAANSKKADAATSPALDLLDLAGYNYASGRYPLEAKAHPDRVILGSETFPQDIAKNWEMVRKYPYLVGDFMWTAWDYLGEAGLGTWAYTADGKGFNKPYPWLLADTGAFDILGDPNGELFWASAVWEKLNAPAICVRPINHRTKPAKAAWRGTNAIPSWSWAGCEGKKAIVEVYANAARVELYLNDRRVGSAAIKQSRAMFKVKYVPGQLEAVAFDASGKETGRNTLASAGDTVSVSVSPEKTTAKPNEIVYVPIRITDGKGIVESNADRKVTVTVRNGELLGFGSANPRTEDSFVSGRCTTYYGKALAAVRCLASGTVTVIADDERGSRASSTIQVAK